MSFTTPDSSYRVLIIPGLYGNGAAHWQSHWLRKYPWFECVEQDDQNVPDLPKWSEKVRQALSRSTQPALVAAHSFGCLATLSAVAQGAPNLAGALLVAPADPEKFGLAEQMNIRSSIYPALLVGSNSDPWMTSERAALWAGVWGTDFLCAGDLGHINAESNLGDWQFGLSLLDQIKLKANLFSSLEPVSALTGV